MSPILSPVDTRPRRLSDYEPFLPPRLQRELASLADVFRGRRMLHVNTTSEGGGVAEMLQCQIGLLRDLGIDAHWRVMKGSAAFFDVTKTIHNGLQGGSVDLTEEQWATYEEFNVRLGAELDGGDWDFILLHDPQTAASIGSRVRPGDAHWVWRCHIDSSQPNPSYALRYGQYTSPFDAHIYSMPEYALRGASVPRFVIPPAIDPLSDKNREMTPDEASRIVAGFGVDPDRPLVTQVSRFDRWKDPLGVYEAFKQSREAAGDAQLALIGSSAADDPEGTAVLAEVERATQHDESVHILPNRCSDRDVKAFTTHSDVVVQKSIREGFGLTVSEALWSGTPVIGGNAGGIPLQVEDGVNGFLVDSVGACAERLHELLSSPEAAQTLGDAGRLRVRERFLLPRMVRDELALWADLDRRRDHAPAKAEVSNAPVTHRV